MKMNLNKEIITKNLDFYDKRFQEHLLQSIGLDTVELFQKKKTERFLLTYVNNLDWSKEEFARQISFQLASWETRSVKGRPKETKSTKTTKTTGTTRTMKTTESWFYLVEEIPQNGKKYIHVFIFLKGETTNYNFIQDFFEVEINSIKLKPYVLGIKGKNWTFVLFYLTKEDEKPIWSIDIPINLAGYFINLNKDIKDNVYRKK